MRVRLRYSDGQSCWRQEDYGTVSAVSEGVVTCMLNTETTKNSSGVVLDTMTATEIF